MTSKGLGPYQGRKAGKPTPRDVLALIQRKCELRALLIEQQAAIDSALPHLDREETQTLLSLMAEGRRTGPVRARPGTTAHPPKPKIPTVSLIVSGEAFVADESIRLRRVASGRAGFLAIPRSARRLSDPKAALL